MVLVVVTVLVIDPELSTINMILGLAAEIPT